MRKRLLSLLLTAALLVSLLPAAFAADKASGYTVTVTKTGFRANGVVNYSGYGSVYFGDEESYLRTGDVPMAALVNGDGKLLYRYRETFGTYHYYDGIVTLSPAYLNRAYSNDPVEYYRLGEKTPFATAVAGTPMVDGVAFVLGEVSESGVQDEYTPYLLGSDGKKRYQLSEDFTVSKYGTNERYTEFYPQHFGKKYGMLDWYNDGLIGFQSYVTGEGGYLDAAGKIALNVSGYTYLRSFCEGYACVRKNGYYGFIDKTGSLVIPCTFNGCSTGFSDGLAGVAKDGKYGYINTAGETVIPFIYDGAYGSGDGLAAVVKDGKCGLVNYQNEVVVPLEYDDISTYAGGVAYAVKDGILYILHITKNVSSDTGTDSTGISFTDVPANAYYTEPVAWAVKQKITEGTSASTFSPSRNCIRAQVITFLWRAAGEPEPTTTKNPFVDVNETAYYYKAVLWARENGITDGTSANRFSPDGTCTRAEVITFLYRFAGKPAVSGEVSSFTDVGSGKFYTDAVAWAVEQKISDGTSSTTFSPSKICTRAEVVTLLYRALAKA
jgi:hypothetical protein